MDSTLEQLRIGWRALRWLPELVRAAPGSRQTLADLVEKRAAEQPDDVFVRFEESARSYRAYNAAANRVAHWALEKGIGRGDVVALLMQNRPEYLEIWTGLAKAGATIALLNSNLVGKALAHGLATSGARLLLLGAECREAFASLPSEHLGELTTYVAADPAREDADGDLPAGAKSLDEESAGYSALDPPRAVRADLRCGDPLFYIYTSGTTGLPKAARFSHTRFMGAGSYALLAGFDRGDTFYCPLPLYHTAGGVMCVSAVLRAGATLALARRFSASRFWREAGEAGATAFQYIGELCRYLLAQPPSEWEGRHQIRLCVGNGMRPDAWERFQQRFHIPRIVEFYGATESNVSMVNLLGRVGSVGKPVPGIQAALIRFDVAAERHPRDARGRCQRCAEGEVGELIGRIREGRAAFGSFEGYTSREATERKILRDVFEPGDAWFRSGDLLRRDADGYYYFVDRIGDTFRWKGENVSTQEVSQALTGLPWVELAAVYGVGLPDADGRAGMAALELAPKAAFDAEALFAHVSGALPAYARPAFLRILRRAEVTSTLKLRKITLAREGFDPATVTDPLFFRDDAARTYRPLTAEVYACIQAGELRF